MELTGLPDPAVGPGWPRRPAVDAPTAARLLCEGDIELLGRMPWSSNATFLVELVGDGGSLLAVYKPRRGERPLWDFPPGTLCDREVAAYEVSEALGWRIVPPSVRRVGPAGDGVIQQFVEHDPDDHYFALLPEHPERFRRFAAFDVVINNTDRKGGHCLLDPAGHVWGIDHGVAFHRHWKLRTVIWDFAGERLDGVVRADLERLRSALDGSLADRLGTLLASDEVDALRVRLEALLAAGRFPEAGPDHHAYPWPLV